MTELQNLKIELNTIETAIKGYIQDAKNFDFYPVDLKKMNAKRDNIKYEILKIDTSQFKQYSVFKKIWQALINNDLKANESDAYNTYIELLELGVFKNEKIIKLEEVILELNSDEHYDILKKAAQHPSSESYDSLCDGNAKLISKLKFINSTETLKV